MDGLCFWSEWSLQTSAVKDIYPGLTAPDRFCGRMRILPISETKQLDLLGPLPAAKVLVTSPRLILYVILRFRLLFIDRARVERNSLQILGWWSISPWLLSYVIIAESKPSLARCYSCSQIRIPFLSIIFKHWQFILNFALKSHYLLNNTYFRSEGKDGSFQEILIQYWRKYVYLFIIFFSLDIVF